MDTVRVTLQELQLALDKVTTSGAKCSLDGRSSADTAVVALLEQAHLSAERAALFAERYPYVLRVQRSLGNASPGGGTNRLDVRAKSIFAVDTVEQAGAPEWHYAAGDLVGDVAGDRSGREHAAMRIPQLADFASDEFAAAHCIRYAGRQSLDGTDVLRIDFAPLPAVRTPDISGSLYCRSNILGAHDVMLS